MPKRINTGTSARDPPWCKDCDADFAGDCVDAGHRPYSAKMLREDKSASTLALLERSVAAGKELSQHTQRFLDAVAREAERNRSSNKLLLDNLQRLRAATADGTAFDTAMQLAKDVVDQVPKLERRAALLASGGRLSVALERKTCARLEAHLQLEDGDDLSLARLLLLQLLDGDKLQEVADEALPSSSGETQLPLPGRDGELDLSRLVKEDIEKLLGDPTRCRQIRKLTCGGSADLAGSLQVAEVSALLAKAKCLKELHLSRAYLPALKGLKLKGLRRLDLNFG